MAPALPQPVLVALNRLDEAGYKGFCVGGCLRELLLGRSPADYDLATDALPEEVIDLFKEYKQIHKGLLHGTVTVVIDSLPLEITTLRIEGAYTDSRHPDQVSFTTSLEADLARRDFTCNAMAWRPARDNPQGIFLADSLIDPFGGRHDLSEKLLRAVGEPARRLQEDGLRILRGLRLAAVLDLTIEPDTRDAMSLFSHLLKTLPAERLLSEFELLLKADFAERILTEHWAVLSSFITEMTVFSSSSAQNEIERAARIVGRCPKDFPLRLAALLYVIGADNPQQTLERLRLARTVESYILTLLLNLTCLPDQSLSPVRRWLSLFISPQDSRDILNLSQIMAAVDEDQEKQNQIRRLTDLVDEVFATGLVFKVEQLAVSGHDLIAAGIAPGPQIGRILKLLLNLVIDERVANRRSSLIAAAQKLALPG